MSSPGGRRRPLSTGGYEPLLPTVGSVVKPKPPPKPRPKPPLAKSFSSTGVTAITVSKNTGVSAEGYFQPSGGSGFGYCLSSVYKGKATSNLRKYESDDVNGESHSGNGAFSSEKPDTKVKFVAKDISPPPVSSLPTKFQISFEERNKQSLTRSRILSEPATGVLVAISDSPNTVTINRPQPAKPNSVDHRMSSPLFTTSPVISKFLPEVGDASNTSLNKNNPDCKVQSQSLDSPTVSPKTPTFRQPVTFAQPLPHELEYVEREYPRNVYENMDRFQKNGILCDVTFIVNDRELTAHRVVLAACSPYFESMFVGEFAEPLNEPIVMEELSDDCLELIINFAYTSRIIITEKNVYSVFEAAELFQLSGVKGACFKFFKQQMNKSNCIRTWLFAESHNCTELLDASLKYIDCNFLDIVQGQEFLDLDQPDIVVTIISREDLAITSEEQVYEAVKNWINSQLDQRRQYSYKVFSGVRFSSLPKDYLMTIVDTEPLIKEDPDLLQLVRIALTYFHPEIKKAQK